MSDPRTKTVLFEAWLARRGTPGEVASFKASIVEGIFRVAGRATVEPAHVAASVGLAEDAGVGEAYLGELRALGELVLRFEQEHAVAVPSPAPSKLGSTGIESLLRIDRFEGWLREHGTAAEIARFRPSTAEGIFLVAGRGAVGAAHVAQSVRLAEDAGIAETHLEEMRVLGALIVRFEASAASSPTPRSTPAKETVPDGADAEREARPPSSDEGASRAAPAPRRRKIAWAAGVAAIALAGVAVVSIGTRAPAPLPTPAPVSPRPPPGEIAAALPAGWQDVPSACHAVGAPEESDTYAFHGGTAADPERGLFVGFLPLDGALADGPNVSDDDLVALTRIAEQGASSRLAADESGYVTNGCSVAAAEGHKVGLCTGVAHSGKARVAIRTYLRVGPKRAVLALYSSRNDASGGGEAESIIARLAP